MKHIKHVIFDLGGVILNVDYELSVKRFKYLGLENFNDLYAQSGQSKLFDDLETGKIKKEEFINTLKNKIPDKVSDQDIVDAWNAMILDFPPKRLELLKRIKRKYDTYLLSNTNVIHEKYFLDLLSQTSEDSLDVYFSKVYFSNRIGLRKPNIEVFQFVLKENNLKPEETLFIDDSSQHLKPAASLGVQTIFLKKGMTIESDIPLFKDI